MCKAVARSNLRPFLLPVCGFTKRHAEDGPHSVEGFGVEAPDSSIINEFGPNPAGLKCDREAVNRKEYSSE